MTAKRTGVTVALHGRVLQLTCVACGFRWQQEPREPIAARCPRCGGDWTRTATGPPTKRTRAA